MTFDPASLSSILDAMVHGSVTGDRLASLRHRSFIANHLFVGLIALAAFPVWLALFGSITVPEGLTFALLSVPVLIAAYLSKTGRLDAAHLLSAAAFTGLLVWIASLTGGYHSLIVVWLALVPFEASLSGSRRVVAAAVVIAAAGYVALLVLAGQGIVPVQSSHNVLTDTLIILGAVLYGGGLAIRVEGFARESARAARRGEERYRLLADHSTDMITRHSATGEVEFASPAVRALTGAAISDVLGDGLFRRVHVADRPAYMKSLSEAYVSQSPVTAEFRLRYTGSAPNDPHYIDVEMRCRPVVDAAGATTAVVAVTRDISKRTESENALRDAREVADRANQAKTQFLAHMSHELRTPLNAIIGFSEILKRDVATDTLDDRRREYAKLIHASGEHLLEVVNGILDMSKIESGMFSIAPERIELPPLVAGCCDMMSQQAADRGVTIVRAVPDNIPAFAADLRACRQILLNLLSNAIKFTDSGGSVTVGARIEGNSIVIFVCDTGIGISEEDLPRLGTPFVQAEGVYSRHYEGTGLGLSMVKGLAALHGGRLMMTSKPGVGTTASVVLPVEPVPQNRPTLLFGHLPPPIGEEEEEEEEKERKSA